jgi:hypothetical protein
MTMPLLVISSRALGLITTRSPRGLSFLLVAVAVANAFPPEFGGIVTAVVLWMWVLGAPTRG